MSLENQVAATVRTLQALPEICPQIDRAAELILTALHAKQKLLICGNGGSAAEASHFAAELMGRYCKNRDPLPAIALNADGALVTCLGNDYGYEQAFARQIAGLAQPGDVVVVFTSSGKSANIVAALQEARRLGLASIAFLGRGGGQAKGVATCELIVPGESGRTAQEAHLFLIHYFCELIDAAS
jgi:D-sedoheptulose 7-phosphate isomerase